MMTRTLDFRRCLVVANPAAGSVTDELVGQVADLCGKTCDVVQAELTGHPGAARDIVAHAVSRSPRPQLVVVVGGDGTAREAAEGLARSLGRWPDGTAGEVAGGEPDPVLLLLPAGTGNSCARAIWGDLTWREVADRALSGAEQVRVRQLDLIRLVEGDRAVLLGASAGFIAAVTEAALSLADVSGRDRYLQAMVATFAGFQPYAGRVLVDGQPLHDGATTLVTVGGARHRVGTFEVLPQSILDDGWLDVCAVRGWGTEEERADLAQRIMTGTHVGYPGVYYAHGRQVVITRDDGRALCFEYDGEMWSGQNDTITLDVVPGAVPVLAPAQPVAG